MSLNLPRNPDMLRPPSGILTMPGPPFLGASQSAQQQQQPQQPAHIGMMQGNPNAANPMSGLLMQSNGPGNPNYQLQMQQAQHRQIMQQRAAQGMNASLGPGHQMNGLGPTQMQGVNFQNAMMQNVVRRVQSQPSPLNQSAGQLGGGGMPGQQMMNSIGGMGMPAQMRQPMQQGPPGSQMRLPQQHPTQGGGMPSDMQMQMNRQGGMPGGPGFAPHIARTASQNPPMPNIPQPPSLPPSHPHGIQQPSFPAGMTMGGQQMHGQPPQQLGSSPHPVHQVPPGGMPNNMTNNMAGTSGMPGAAPQQRIPPDRERVYNFSNPQMQPNMQPRMTPGNVPMGFGSVSNTPNPQVGTNQQMGDMQQPLGGGNLTGQQRSTSRQGGGALIATPAEMLNTMNGETFSAPFNMHPQNPAGAAPPRPPSQQRMPYPMPPQQQPLPQQQQQQQQQPSHGLQPPMGVHRSPRQPDMAQQMMQRPGSQPQVASAQSPQRTGRTNTPRVLPSQLPQAGGMNVNRTPLLAPAQPQGPPAPPPKPPTPASANAAGAGAQHVTITSRPQQLPPTITSQAPQPPLPPSGAGPAPHEAGPSVPQQPPQPQPPNMMPQRAPPGPYPFLVGNGQSLLRLLQFSGVLAGDNTALHNQKLRLDFWKDLVRDYFTTRATFKLTLWKEHTRLEAKPFEIGTPILPRYFLVTAQSGVRCMTLNLDGARERAGSPTHGIVECVQAIWTYRYWNGWTITMKGPMTVHVLVVPNVPSANQTYQPGSYTLKFDQIQFDASTCEKLLSCDALSLHLPSSPASQATPLPDEENQPAHHNEPYRVVAEGEERLLCKELMIPLSPINAFGIPQATMRCLELAESVTQMSDLIKFSTENHLGPKDALSEFAKQLRERQHLEGSSSPRSRMNGTGGPHGNRPSPPGMPENAMIYNTLPGSSLSDTTPVLFPGPPQANQTQPPPPLSQQNGPPTMDGTPKQSKAIPPQQQQQQQQPIASASTPSASTPAASTPTAATMTPVSVPSSLKRKAGDSSSPNIANAEQQPLGKRARGKRRSTATG